MRTLKKTLSLVLVLAMVCSFFVMGTSAAFEDADEITAKYVEAVEVMNSLEILQGSNGSFDPQGTLTRAQAARIIVAMLGADDLAKVATSSFTDVVGHWGYKFIAYCESIGLMKGYGDGTVGPDDELTGPAFALMVMKALKIDVSSVNPATYALDTVALAVNEGLASVELLTAEPFTRELAAQLAFNGMNYTADAEEGYPVWNDNVNADGKISAGEAIYDYYPTIVEAKEAATLLGGSYKYGISILTSSDASLLATVFGVSRVTGAADDYGRPATVYYDYLGNLMAVYNKAASYTFVGAVSEKELYSTLGAKVCANYAFSDSVNGSALTTAAAPAAKLTTAYGNTADGSVTYIYQTNYAGGTGKVEIFTVESFLGTVKKVTEATAAGAPRFVTLTTGETFITGDFAKGDVVVYTVDGTGAVITMDKAPVVSGTLTKFQSAGIYTVDGKDYTVATNGTTALSSLRVNTPVSFYTDLNGFILADIGAAPTAATYIRVLAAKTPVTDALTGGSVTEVYGVLSNGTAGWFTFAGPITVTAGTTDDVYEYTIHPVTGLYILGGHAAEAAYTPGIAVGVNNIGGGVAGGTGTYVVNSDTVFYFIDYKTGSKEVDEVTVKTGSANIGANIAANKSYVVAEKGVVKYVFVDTAFDNIINDGEYVFVKANLGTVTEGKNTYTKYAVYNIEGDTVVLLSETGAPSAGDVVVSVDGFIGDTDKKTASGVITAINGDTVTVNGSTYLTLTDDTVEVYCNDDAALAVGQTITWIVVPTTSKAAVIFVTADQLTYAINVTTSIANASVATGNYAVIVGDANVDNTIVVTVSGLSGLTTGATVTVTDTITNASESVVSAKATSATTAVITYTVDNVSGIVDLVISAIA